MPVQHQPVALTAADGSLLVMRVVIGDGREAGVVAQMSPVAPTDVEREITKASEAWALYSPELVPIRGWMFISEADLPSDRTYRQAWRAVGKAIVQDLAVAREIQREMIRADRAPLLAELDVQFMRAIERGDTVEQERIRTRKQKLRDATKDPRIDAAKTIDQLKAISLEEAK